MGKPLVVGNYQITWSSSKGKFIVKRLNSPVILYENEIGKECYDWVMKRQAKDNDEVDLEATNNENNS